MTAVLAGETVSPAASLPKAVRSPAWEVGRAYDKHYAITLERLADKDAPTRPAGDPTSPAASEQQLK